MKARKVSVARQLHHPHEAQASVVVITDQQATECRRRRVDHEVGERKLALVSDGGIDLALQTLDEFLPYVIRRLYGLDNADKQKNITSTWYNLLYTTYTDTIYKYMSETKTCRHAVRTGCPVSHGKAISKSHHNNETKKRAPVVRCLVIQLHSCHRLLAPLCFQPHSRRRPLLPLR